MLHLNRQFTGKRAEIALSAMYLIQLKGRAITVWDFCNYTGYRDNRHTRGVLNEMAYYNWCVRQKVLYTDGHYRMVYSAKGVKIK